MKNLYEEIMVWKRVNAKSSVRYCCFRNVRTGKYAVQSADFFYLPVDDEQRNYLSKQFIELFTATDPGERCRWFDTLVEAIDAHEKDFS